MEIFNNARATDLDPLSVFPSEAETGPRKVGHQETDAEADHSSPEVIALVSALSDLQTSVHVLAEELTELQEIARGARHDADRAIKVAMSFETRISALETRHVIGRRQPTLARPQPATTNGIARTTPNKDVPLRALPPRHPHAQASRRWESYVNSWRRLLHLD